MKLWKPIRFFNSESNVSESNVRVVPYPAGLNLAAILLFVLALAAVGAMTAGYALLYGDKVYPGIAILDTDIGGSTEDQARQRLQERLQQLADSELALRYGDARWTTSQKAFGLRYDVDRMVVEGYSFGRSGNLLQQLGDRLHALFNGHSSSTAIWFEKSTQEAILGKIAAEVDRPEIDAEIVLAPDGTVQIIPSQTRLEVDVEATMKGFADSFTPFSTKEFDVVVHETRPEIVDSDLRKTQATAQAIIGRPLTLKFENRSWSISERELTNMVVFSRISGQQENGSQEKIKAYLDHAMLAEYLRPIAAEIDLKPKDATLKYANGEIVPVLGNDGAVLDVDATVASINAQAVGDQRVVNLVRKTQGPAIVLTSLQEPRTLAEKMIAEPLTLQHGDLSWRLGRGDLGEALVFGVEEVEGKRKIALSFDRNVLDDFFERVNRRISKPAKDARFRFQGGQLSVLSESADGIELDVDATLAAMEEKTRQGNRTVEIVTKVTKPKVLSSDKDKIVIKDLLATASTSYAGSIPERAHNVKLATSRLDGVVIPPGETFSMNAALGPATLSAGFQIGYGITVSGTEMITIPSEAGGICQVATTLYHSAFWAGLTIVNRLEHLYWIPRYGQPPLGMKGLDATVDAPYVDLLFKNNTSNWLAIQSRTDSNNVYFSIYGTKTGWQVKVDGPIISNIVPAEQEMTYQEDPTMPWGKELFVEHAEDGFMATVIRTILKDGQVIDKYTSVSRYRPSRNVTLVGTKGRPEPTEADPNEPKTDQNAEEAEQNKPKIDP